MLKINSPYTFFSTQKTAFRRSSRVKFIWDRGFPNLSAIRELATIHAPVLSGHLVNIEV